MTIRRNDEKGNIVISCNECKKVLLKHQSPFFQDSTLAMIEALKQDWLVVIGNGRCLCPTCKVQARVEREAA